MVTFKPPLCGQATIDSNLSVTFYVANTFFSVLVLLIKISKDQFLWFDQQTILMTTLSTLKAAWLISLAFS